MKLFHATCAFLLLATSIKNVSSHGTEVRQCVTPNGFLRIFVEHWHGSSISTSSAGTMTIRQDHLPGQPTTTLNPTGVIANTLAQNLPGCVGGAMPALVLECQNEVHNNWVWYDFPVTCNAPVTYTLLSGNTVVLTEACSSLYPATISGTIQDSAAPAIDIDGQICDTSNTIVVSSQTANYNDLSMPVNWIQTIGDDCDPSPILISSSHSSGQSFGVGNTQVSLQAQDNIGHVSDCIFTVQVTTPPPPPVQALCQGTVTVSPNQVIDPSLIDGGSNENGNPGSITSMTVSPDMFSCSDVGSTRTVQLTIVGSGGTTDTCTTAVVVQDVTPPSAQCKSTIISLDSSDFASIAAADIDNGSFDSCGGAVAFALSQTSFGCVDVGQSSVTLTVTDESGNSATCSGAVIVQDITPPSAQCKPATISLDPLNFASIVSADIDNGSFDSCGGAVALSLSQTSFNCGDIGQNPVTLTATDENGNSATCTETVTVQDITPPSAQCKSTIISLDSSDFASIAAADIDNGSFDSCGGAVAFALSQTSFGCVDVGQSSVTLTVTDESGNSATCSGAVIVQDITPPSAQCKPATISLDPLNFASIVSADIDNGSFDSCGGAVALSLSQTSFNCGDIGQNPVTLTATDENGNSATCTETVTVQDITPPSAQCKSTIITLDSTGSASVVAADIDDGSVDSCGGALTLTLSENDFGCQDVGDNNVILSVNDESNNQDTCTGTITVLNGVPTVDPIDAMVVFVDGASGSPSSNGDITVTATDPEGQELSYSWTTDCGNGFSASTQSTTISFGEGTEPKVCSVTAEVCDICGSCASQIGLVIVVDPAAGFVTGGGWIQSPVGAYVNDTSAEGKASFGFVAKYKKGQSIPDGQTQFVFSSVGFDFSSTAYEWLVVTGDDCAKFKGIGKVGSAQAAENGFLLTACDKGEPAGGLDTFRIKIWSLADDEVIYDNHMGHPDDSYDGTVLGGGNIQIHQPGGGGKNNRMLRATESF